MPIEDSTIRLARILAANARARGDLMSEGRELYELARRTRDRWPDETESIRRRLKSVGEELTGQAKQDVSDARQQGDPQAEAAALARLAAALLYADRGDEAELAFEQFRRLSNAENELNEQERSKDRRDRLEPLFPWVILERVIEQEDGEDPGTTRIREQRHRHAAADETITFSSPLGPRYDDTAVPAGEESWLSAEERFALNEERAAQAAQEIAEAHKQGDWRTEISAFRTFSSALHGTDRHGLASGADRQILRIIREQRVRERAESASEAVSTAREQGDQTAEALALLAHGQALADLGQSVDAERLFEQAEQLSYDVAAALKVAAHARQEVALETELSTLRALARELGNAGRTDAAQHVAEQARWMAQFRTPAVTNTVSNAEAGSVIQVGVVHGGMTVRSEPRLPPAGVNVSVTTEQDLNMAYRYYGEARYPDLKVEILVEAFTTQAVILRRLHPVIVRRVDEPRSSGSWGSGIGRPGPGAKIASMPRRVYTVRLDSPFPPTDRHRRLVKDLPPPSQPFTSPPSRPPTSYDALLDNQDLDLDAAFAAGEADFPFYVTASDPEYFVIVPQARQTKGVIEWRLDLDWSCMNQHGTVKIDHGDRPFVSDGLAGKIRGTYPPGPPRQ